MADDPHPTIPLQVYIDAAFAAHQKLHEAEEKSRDSERTTLRWAITTLPVLVASLIGLVYFIIYIFRGGN